MIDSPSGYGTRLFTQALSVRYALNYVRGLLLVTPIFLCTHAARAQTSAGYPAPASAEAARLNETVLQSWEKKTGQPAQVTTGAGGESKIEFTGNVVADLYHNSITAPGGNLATPLNNGTFGKAVTQMDLRGTSADGDVTYMQGSITATNDRAVLSRYPNQLTNFQLGRAGQGYQITGGDVAVNYSQLGSALGLRGFQGAKQFGALTVSAFGGLVADSWEALMDRDPTQDGNPARQRYLRNVFGGKIDYAISKQIRVFATTQGYGDQEGSLPAGQASSLLAASTRSVSTGFAYQEGTTTLNGEIAKSHFSESSQLRRDGNAYLLHGVHKIESVALRAGTNNISANYASLAQAVPPGVRDAYVGADWTAAAWVTLSTELRNSRTVTPPVSFAPIVVVDPNTNFQVVTPPPPPTPGTTSTARSWTNRANLNLDQYWKGSALQLSNTATRGNDAAGFDTRNSSSAMTLSRNAEPWTGSFGLGWQGTYSSSNPVADSRTPSAQAALTHTWSDAAGGQAPTWMFTLGGMTNWSHQQLINAGTGTTSKSIGLTAGGQIAKDKLNAALQYSTASRPTDGAVLRTISVMVDATHTFNKEIFLKVYIRDTLRNDGDIMLRTREQSVGTQLGISW